MYPQLTEDQKNELGLIVKTIRRGQSLTQQDVAFSLGICRQYVSSIESGGIGTVCKTVKGRVCPWQSAIFIFKGVLPYTTEDQRETMITLVGAGNLGITTVQNKKIKELIELLRLNGDKLDDKFVTSLTTAVTTSVKSNALKNYLSKYNKSLMADSDDDVTFDVLGVPRYPTNHSVFDHQI